MDVLECQECKRCKEVKPIEDFLNGAGKKKPHRDYAYRNCLACREHDRVLAKIRMRRRSKSKVVNETDLVKELFRHYVTIKDYSQARGTDVLEYNGLTFSLREIDLMDLKILTHREREAFFYNIVLDLPQVEVAEIMGIATPTVGQTVDRASQKLAAFYWPPERRLRTSK